MTDLSNAPSPRFRRRLLGYAPAEVDAYVSAVISRDATVATATAELGAEMAEVVRGFATTVVAARQQAEDEAQRVRDESAAAAAATRADAEAKAAQLLELADALRAEAQATASQAVADAAETKVRLREMAHEMVDRVLADATLRLAVLTTSCEEVQTALDAAEAGLRTARDSLTAMSSPDTDEVGSRAHQVVDLITLEAESARQHEQEAAAGASREDDAALSSIDALYQRSTP